MMTLKEFHNLFPNKEAFIIFALYIILFVFQGIFVTASKSENGNYNYSTVLVVLLVEVLKLVASAVIYTWKQEKKPNIFKAIVINYKLLLLYFIPSLLYCFYNNLAFVNLHHFDPTSYYILLQFRVVLTAIIYQCLFSRKLSYVQWISLVVLTVGCMIKNFDVPLKEDNNSGSVWDEIFSIYFISINFQNFCSCLAGTYNEYLLKTNSGNVDIFLQNVFMYMDSVVCNIFFFIYTDQSFELSKSFADLNNTIVILIIINSAVVGIVTSFFLKNLNSILKTYASALELVITAVACYIIFGIRITLCTIVSILLVIIAVAMYFKNPVKNANMEIMSVKNRDKKPLLPVVSEQ